MLLAIETAFGTYSIALFADGKLVDSFFSKEVNQQAELLIPSIEEILKRNNIWYDSLKQIAANVGPGSFTGLRIGLAAAKGIALAAEVKTAGISSLQASALKHDGGKVYLDASRGEAYYQEFDAHLKALSEPVLVKYVGQFSALPDAVAIGEFALRFGGDAKLEPLYVRKPDAKLPTQKS